MQFQQIVTTTTRTKPTTSTNKAPPPTNGTVAKKQPTPPPPAAFAAVKEATKEVNMEIPRHKSHAPAAPAPAASKNTTPLNHQHTVVVAQEKSPPARPAVATPPSETTTTTTTTKENVQGEEDTSSSKPNASSNGTKEQVEVTTTDNGYDPMADVSASVDQQYVQAAPAPSPKEGTAVAPPANVVEEKKSETKEPNEEVLVKNLEPYFEQPATTTNETTTQVATAATSTATATEAETPTPAPAAPKGLTSADFQLDPSNPNFKLKRKLTKKLRQIEGLEQKGKDNLTPEQLVKIDSKRNVLESLQELE